MKAIVTVKGKQVSLKEVPVPTPRSGQILVKVVAVAQNPIDCVHVQRISGPGLTVGHDFAGLVEEIGPDVPAGLRKKGERVAGCIHGGYTEEDGGSFAEYLVADAHLVIPLPEGISFEDAATLPVGSVTACQALYESLVLPPPEAPSRDRLPILVWGAASGVGQLVVQLATLSNFQVIATASPSNHALVKSLGAEVVFDYKDPFVTSKIKSLTDGKLKYAADCVSTLITKKQIGEALSDGGGRVAIIGHTKAEEQSELRRDVEFIFSSGYTIFGRAWKGDPFVPENIIKGRKWFNFLSRLLAENKLKGVRTKLFSNGLASVPEGLQYMMDGNVHGEKIVYRIADTP